MLRRCLHIDVRGDLDMNYVCHVHGEVEPNTVRFEGVHGHRTIQQELCPVCESVCDPAYDD